MKTEYRIIILACLSGLLFWVIDTAVDYSEFYATEGTFWDLLILNVPPHEVYIRTAILAMFVVFGILTAAAVARRRRIEEALAVSRDTFRSLVENINDWVWEVDEDLVITYASGRTRDIIGYDPEEIRGRKPAEMMSPDEAQRVIQVIEPIVAGRKSFVLMESTLLHKDGRAVVTETSITPKFDDAGAFRGYRGVTRDVTHRKRTEEALALTQFSVDTAAYAVFWVEPDARFAYVNESAARSLGYSREELLSMSVHDVDPDFPAQRWPAFWRELKERHSMAFESRHRTRDGKVFPVHITANHLEFGGKEYLFGFVADITERKRAEQALALTQFSIETAVVPIFWLHPDSSVAYVNESAARSLGYSKEELLTMGVLDFDPDFSPQIWERTWNYLKERHSLAFETRHRHKDGTAFPVEITANLFEFGGREYSIAIAHNISERKRAEERLALTQFSVDTAAFPIAWVEPGGQFAYVNQSTARLLGYSAEELLSMSVPDIDPSVTCQAWQEIWRGIKERGAMTLETLHRAKDGTIFPVEITTNYFEFAGREYSIAVVHDITERKRAEEALALTQFSVDTATYAVFWVEPDARFAYVNESAARSLGYSRAELLSMSVHDVDPDFPAQRWPAFWRELKERHSMAFESRHRTKDGKVFPVQITANHLEFGGKEYLFGFVADITERKRAEEELRDSEERFRLLFEYSPDMVFVTRRTPDVDTAEMNQASSFIAVNAAVTTILGYERDELIGRTILDISPEIQPDGVSTREKVLHIRDVLPEAGPQNLEWTVYRKNGELVDCEVRLVAYEIDQEIFVQAIARDITERKQAEEERRKLERDLEAQKRLFYRETILSVTAGKLDICDAPDVRRYTSKAQETVGVRTPREAAQARGRVKEFCREKGLTGERLDTFMTGVGEAITNALKHGKRGRVYAGVADEAVWVAISDKGRGIESLILPRATLAPRFSTKPSLGLGYSIILEVVDHILLKTDARGTTVVLVKYLKEPEATISPDEFADTWDSIPT